MARPKTKLSSEEIEALRERASKAIAPLKPADRAGLYEVGTTRTKGGIRIAGILAGLFFARGVTNVRARRPRRKGRMDDVAHKHIRIPGDVPCKLPKREFSKSKMSMYVRTLCERELYLSLTSP